MFFSRRKDEQLCILWYGQYNLNRNDLYLWLLYIFHQDVVCLLISALLLCVVDFKKTEYFFVHWLMVLLVTFTLSCWYKWYFVLNNEKPSICWWTARTIIFGSCLIRSKPFGSTKVERQELQRYRCFMPSLFFLVPRLTIVELPHLGQLKDTIIIHLFYKKMKE